LNQIKES